jgi:hypothetical protein
MQMPSEGSSGAEDEAQQRSDVIVPQQLQLQLQPKPPLPLSPPRQPRLHVQQQHASLQSQTDDDSIPVRVYSELPVSSPQAAMPQSRTPSGLPGTFRRLAAGWSLSEAQLNRGTGDGGSCSRHDQTVRHSGITSSGTFKRLDSMRPLPGMDGRRDGDPGGSGDIGSVSRISEGLERSSAVNPET